MKYVSFYEIIVQFNLLIVNRKVYIAIGLLLDIVDPIICDHVISCEDFLI